MKTITISNRKGGIGKTTLSTHIAAGLATLGYQVGVVDTDSQGHTGLMLGMPEENGLYNLMIDRHPIEQVTRLVPPENYSTADHPAQGNLYLIPGAEKTYKIPLEIDPGDSFLFLELMDTFADTYRLDVIIIDTNPTVNLLDGAVYMATDAYIYVAECERLSLDGVQKAIAQFTRFTRQRQQYLGRDSRILGIVPNKVRANTALHRSNITALAHQYPGMVWSPIILRTLWAEASNVQELIYTYAPTGQEARDAWTLVQRVQKELQAWQTVAE